MSSFFYVLLRNLSLGGIYMKVVKIASVAALTFNLVGGPINVFASENQDGKLTVASSTEASINSTLASVKKFDLYGKNILTSYNEVFQMPKTNIKSISNNGGKYYNSTIDKAIDGNMNTHWETGTPNSASFTNEVVISFNEEATLNRIVYAARQESTKGKGFAQQFEIYSSTSDSGNDFTLVSSGEYTGSTGDIVEIQFTPTEFKRVKFVFKKANQDWASAAEFQFYKEDSVRDKMNNLFTDSTFSSITKEFATPAALNQLEEEAKDHPLYSLFKEDLENAKALQNQKEIGATLAAVSKLKSYGTIYDKAYSEAFRMPNSNISTITTNGGSYPGTKLEYMLDDLPETHWETTKNNDANFTNELIFTLEQEEVLNRIAFLARSINQKGFPEKFEIYASQTSKGDTFQLVSSGTAVKTSEFLEFKFQPTKFKRIKFVFTKAYIDRPFAAEFRFYKEDPIDEKISNLFTDETMSAVSAEYDSLEKINALEAEAKDHPLYNTYKEDIENAKILINAEKTEATTAITTPFEHYSNEAYTNLFKMDNQNIASFSNNGGRYLNQVLDNAFDGNTTTYWETNASNTNDFSNTVEVTFKEAVTLNRIVYGARPSDRKGFAEEFEIYGSKTSKGDTYELVATGKYSVVTGLVQAKFEPTTFKRVKFVFKKSTQNWATLNELAFYKEDPLADSVNNLFTDGTMSAVVPKYNSINKLNELEQKILEHPLYSDLKEKIDLAKKIVNGEVAIEGTIITAEQHGNMKKHASENLKFGLGNNNQPTGLVAMPGDQITVYVESYSSSKLPSLIFTQQEGSWSNWAKSVQLVPGKNTITVPEIPTDNNYHKDVTKGGPIYIVNPYTAEEQGQAPKIRFEGVQRFPMMTKDQDPEEFKAFLIDYKKQLDEDKAANPDVKDRTLIDVVEMVSDHVVYTGTATKAYEQFITKGNNPLDTVTGYDTWMHQIFEFYGLDGRSDSHDPKNIRENIRIMQPWGFMYAAGDHTGIQSGQDSLLLADFSKTYPGWGVNHEIGHRMDVGVREYGEITNNMLSMGMSIAANSLDNRIPFEKTIYKYVIEENKVTMASQSYEARLGAFWQLELAHPGYWGELNSLYRERNVSLSNGDNSKQQYLIEYSSEVLGLDLSSYFARHGFTVNAETKEKVSKYPAPKKLWYLNNSVVGYEGNGLSQDTTFTATIKTDEENKKNTLSFTIDKEKQNDLLGYEIYRDGELIGFTSTAQFIDQDVDTTKNYTYKVVAYDKKLNTLNPVEVKAFTPTLSVEEFVTLKLYQTFDPMQYVKAISYNGQDLTNKVDVQSNNVDVTKKGSYEIVYKIVDEGITQTKTTHVTVTSDIQYVSDMTAKSSTIQYGGLKKDTATPGTPITLIRQGVDVTYKKGLGTHANSEVVYDIEGKDFDFFESYIGIDQNAKGKASSATFQVWVDGEKKYDSKVFKSDTEHEFIKIPVTGAKEVTLITTDAKDNGNSFDHTVWADAKFTKQSSKPIITISEDLTMVKLNSKYDLLQDVTASDIEDGDLKQQIQVKDNGFTTNKTGTYTIEYTVRDKDNLVATASKTIYVYSDEKFASDINWKSAQTAWSTVNKDKASSGGSIKLLVNGEKKEFTKGIGTHANSSIVYDLKDKNFDYFEALVGVDQNIPENNNSSVTFKILADGQEVYNSGVMKYNTEAKLVRVPVKGVKELTLIANDSNNGNTSDHANFANAKFYISNGLPQLSIPKDVATKVGTPIDIKGNYSAQDAEDGNLTETVQVTGADKVNFNRTGKYEILYSVRDSDGNEMTKKRTISVVDMNDYHYLSDFDWTSIKYSYAAPVKDLAISHNKIRLTGEDGSVKAYDKGIGAHSNSTIIYDLEDKNADYFTAFVGVDRQMFNTVGSVVFQVYVDGEKQFDSGLMNSKDPQQFIEVNISGAKELKLVVTDGGNGNGSDHASWGDAKLHFANPDRVFTQDLTQAIEEAKAINNDDYTTESWNALQAILIKAEELLTNSQATQLEIDQAVESIKQAIDALEAIDFEQVILIQDNYLKKAIQKELGLTGDITLRDMYKLTSLNSPSARITSLEGLQYAKNLATLNISGNEIKDFSPLKDLQQLDNIIAHPQIIAMDSLKGPDLLVENVVKGLDGNFVNPYQIGLRNTKTNKEIFVDVEQLTPNADQFTIDLSKEDKGSYMLVIAYKLNEDSIIQLFYYVNNQ